MAPYHILIAMISSVIPGNLVLVVETSVESEQFGPMAKCHLKRPQTATDSKP